MSNLRPSRTTNPSASHGRRLSSDIATNPTADLTQSQLLPSPPHPHTQTPDPQSPPPPPPTTSNPPNTDSPSPSLPDDDDDDHDHDQAPLPLSLSTSTLLSTTIPTDALTALSLATASLDPPSHKITVRFHAIGDAPPLKQKVAKVGAASSFGVVVRFLRRRLYGAEGEGGKGRDSKGEGLFCYVNSVFAPGLDEGVGNLWRCFKVDDQLIVAYSRTPAFG